MSLTKAVSPLSCYFLFMYEYVLYIVQEMVPLLREFGIVPVSDLPDK